MTPQSLEATKRAQLPKKKHSPTPLFKASLETTS